MNALTNSIWARFLSIFFICTLSIPNTFALNNSEESHNEFIYKDRLLYAVNNLNLAVDAFNSGQISNFYKVLDTELDDIEKKDLTQTIKAKDRLPNAYVVDNTKIVFYYVNGSELEDAGMVMNFDEIGDGIIKVNNKKYTYNQTRSYFEWKNLFNEEKSDVSFLVFIPVANAFLSKFFSSLGALIAGLFGGGKSRKTTTFAGKSYKIYSGGNPGSFITMGRTSGPGLFGRRSSQSNEHSSSVSSKLQSMARALPDKNASRSIASSRVTGATVGARVANAAKSMWGYLETSSWPVPKFKCAQQASTILKKAGVVNGTFYTVVGLVRYLKAKGWRVSSTPVKGAIVFSNPEFGTRSSRSHVGIIGEDGAAYHNSGSAGGRVIRTEFGEDSYNGRWLNGVKFLVPPGASYASL